MKLVALLVLKTSNVETPVILDGAYSLQEFSYFQRGSVKEFCTFLSRTVAARIAAGSREMFPKEEYRCYAYSRSNGVCGVLIADQEYPSRVAFSVLNKAIDESDAALGSAVDNVTEDFKVSIPQLQNILKQFQNPSEADKLTRIQKDLDETKVVMHQAIESVLERGEKLDTLVDKSSDLSMQSKLFYRTAKKHNQCCSIQ